MVSNFKLVEQHNVLTTPDFCFEIDEYKRGGDQMLLAHIRMARWSPSVCKRLLQQWVLFRKCVTAPLFALAEVDDDKWVRFVSLLGFKPFQQIMCENGEQRLLYIHTLPKDHT